MAIPFLLLFLLIGLTTGHGHKHSVESEEDSANDTLLNRTNLDHHGKHPPAKWEVYLYGVLSVSLISLLSLLGVIVLPCINNKSVFDSVMLTLMSMAVGSMTSDALLHLVPETLGMDDLPDEDSTSSGYIGKMCTILAGIYGLYMLELILHRGAKLMNKMKVRNNISNGEVENGGPKLAHNGNSNWSSGIGHHGGHSHSGQLEESHTILGIKSVAFVIILSDAMHNFTDGLAIGAAYSTSSSTGLGVTVAVICHEIPHEIGNFAILLNSGMSFKKALFLNFVSAATSFAGLFPGILAGGQETLARWIFAVVAAGFLYVALVHMLRELQNYGNLPDCLSFILQNLGMLIGFGTIFLLAIYEDALNGAG